MKSIAIQLAGQVRFWDRAEVHFKNIKEFYKDKFNIDFFIATWDTVGIHAHDYEVSNREETNIDTSFFTSYNISGPLNEGKGIHTLITWLQADRWNKVTELRWQHEKLVKKYYDFVILTRPDIVLTESFFDKVEELTSTPPKIWAGSRYAAPNAIYSMYGTLPMKPSINPGLEEDRYHAKDIEQTTLVTDDRLFCGHPLAMDVFHQYLLDVRTVRGHYGSHTGPADLFMRNKIINLPFHKSYSRDGFALNREVNYEFMNQEEYSYDKMKEAGIKYH